MITLIFISKGGTAFRIPAYSDNQANCFIRVASGYGDTLAGYIVKQQSQLN